MMIEKLLQKIADLPVRELWGERKKHFKCLKCEKPAHGIETVFLDAKCHCGGRYVQV